MQSSGLGLDSIPAYEYPNCPVFHLAFCNYHGGAYINCKVSRMKADS